MKNVKYHILLLVFLMCSNITFGQAPPMGTIENFVFFTSNGAVANTSFSQVTGDIATPDAAGVSGFQNVNGVISTGVNAVTTQAVTDLSDLCTDLNARVSTSTLPLEIGGVSYTAAIYEVPGAGTLTGTITLDAEGDADALFIFQIAGAFAPAANSEIILTNGALACNVFFITTAGAIAIAVDANLKGNFIAQPGANSMAARCSLEGRLLSTSGAIGFSTGAAHVPLDCGVPLLTGPTAPTLGEVACYALFSSNANAPGISNTGTTYINGDVGINSGTGTTSGFTPAFITGNIHSTPDASTASCATDIAIVHAYLDGLTEDIELLYPATFGNKQVLTPHTYLLDAATTLTDTIFLDARGIASAVFIFKITNTFSTTSNSVVMLLNGAQATNVYWIVDGAISFVAGTKMKGTVIVDGAAIVMNSCSLEGRILTTSGTITVTTVSISKATNCFAPIAPYVGPAPAMGIMTDFVLFSTTKDIAITATSQVTGDIGSHSGSITVTQNINGNKYNADATTATGKTDLESLYASLNATASTSTHGLVLGNGESLNGQVYNITATATLNGNLTLDGQGNANSVFIFKISSTLDIGANAQIILTDGALACNVFWVTQGDITFSTGTTMKGTFIANNCDISYSSSGDLEGRLLAIAGAIGFGPGTAYTPLGCTVAALTGPAAPALAKAACFGIFSSSGNLSDPGTTTVNGDVGSDAGTTLGFDPILVSYTIHAASNDTTVAVASEVNAAYTYLATLTDSIELEFPTAFGNKQILTPHIYRLTGNTTLSDTLFFDAQGDASGVFVIQIDGDFAANASSVVTLINGALAENIYWSISGAINAAAISKLKGTLIGNSTIDIASGCFLEGHVFSTTGDITVDALTISRATSCPDPVPTTGPLVSLGAAADYVFFTKAGIVTNTGAGNVINGDVGTAAGSFATFPAITGDFHNNDAQSATAAADLQTAYDLLMGMAATVTRVPASFGNGEILKEGVYLHNAAASINGTLTLDGEGDQDHAFVFQIKGGALAGAADVTINLINDARICNVFWVCDAAITAGARSAMKGSFIAKDACSNTGGDLDGGLYSIAGAINFGASTANTANKTSPCITPPPPVPLPVQLLSFTGECNYNNIELNWSTASEINNDYYSVERSADGVAWYAISTFPGGGNSSDILHYSFIDINNNFENSYYRLKQTDFDGDFIYSEIIKVKNCEQDFSFTELGIYPNPASKFLNVFINFPEEQIVSMAIHNLFGEMIYYSETYQSKIVFENKLNGIYILELKLGTQTLFEKFVILN